MSGIGFKRTIGTGAIPVWQGIGKDISVFQGGFGLSTTGLPAGKYVLRAAPLIVDEAARTAVMVGTARLYANAASTDVVYQVNKDHTFKIGDYLAFNGSGGKAYAITAIDTITGGTVYDILTVGTTIGAGSAGATMYASTGTGATSSAYPAVNAFLYDEVSGDPGNSVTGVYRGIVYANRCNTPTGIFALVAGIKVSLSK